MESYTYVNIFATKGLEYILLLLFLVMFVFLVRYLSGNGNAKRSEEIDPDRSDEQRAG